MKEMLSLCLVVAVLAVSVGCKKKAPVDATQPLQQSFQQAEPEVQKAIQTATASLKAQNYLEASRALAPIVTGRKLTEAQKDAVGVALHQMNNAIAANPSLDTKEMYELRQKMFQAAVGGRH
jgi:aconitase B